MEIDVNAFQWYSPLEKPFQTEGLAFLAEDGVYRRLPLRTRETLFRVNPNLNELSEDPAGASVRFRTAATRIAVRAEIGFRHDMANMPAIGQCGFDLYAKLPGISEYRFFGVPNYDIREVKYESEFYPTPAEGEKDVMIHLPLYCSLKSLTIGVEAGCGVEAPSQRARSGKIVFYGTSITQGGCASRPGMAYPSQLSRRLDIEAVNLGFSANGLGEYEMADCIAEIKDARLVVLDYEANAGTNGRLVASLKGFIERIRRSRSETPILVVSRIPYAGDFYDDNMHALREELREFQRKTVEELGGSKNRLYFKNGYELFPRDFFEFTVDYIHPSDLGLKNMADGLYPVIEEILRSENV